MTVTNSCRLSRLGDNDHTLQALVLILFPQYRNDLLRFQISRKLGCGFQCEVIPYGMRLLEKAPKERHFWLITPPSNNLASRDGENEIHDGSEPQRTVRGISILVIRNCTVKITDQTGSFHASPSHSFRASTFDSSVSGIASLGALLCARAA